MPSQEGVSFILYAGDIPVEVTKRRVRNLNLRVTREGRCVMSIPLRCSRAFAQSFLDERQAWLEEKMAASRRRISAISAERYLSGSHTMLWGEPCTVMLELEEVQSSRQSVSFDLDQKTVTLKLGRTAFDDSDEGCQIRHDAIREVRKLALETRLPELAEQAEERVGAAASGWHVRDMKTRWGSCSTGTGQIRLASELSAYPIFCAEAVACHEACHLIVPNHSAAFYRELTRAYPDWQHARQYLKQAPRPI